MRLRLTGSRSRESDLGDAEFTHNTARPGDDRHENHPSLHETVVPYYVKVSGTRNCQCMTCSATATTSPRSGSGANRTLWIRESAAPRRLFNVALNAVCRKDVPAPRTPPQTFYRSTCIVFRLDLDQDNLWCTYAWNLHTRLCQKLFPRHSR